VASYSLLAGTMGLDERALDVGLRSAEWPGRLQVLAQRPLTLLDGAHNPAGARVLAGYVRGLRARGPTPRTAWVVGVLRDKDWKRMFAAWKPLADRFFVATPPDARGLPAAEAAAWLRRRGATCGAAASLPAALKAARAWAGPGGLVVAAGSLYSVGALLKARRVR
jgi:dihydrofolate synthase/folylpolyglutamate synthase